MPKKQTKGLRKYSHEGARSKVRYQEKAMNWQCGVCGEVYDQSQDFCLGCTQSLYYYCYINNQMFVTKDDSYLEYYYHIPNQEFP